jgi:hypothetical protein
MSRNARRIAVSLGTAAGGALIAASLSMGTAPVAGADVLGADAVSDLIPAIPASDAQALAAAGVSDTMALSYLIEAIDPNSFTSAGAPQDLLGLIGYYTDTYFLGPTGLDADLAPLVEELVGKVSSGTPGTYTPEISELTYALDPDSFTSATALTTPTDEFGELAYLTDTYLFGPFGIDNLIAPYVQEIIASLPSGAESVDVSPAADLVAGLDPSAFSAGVADLAPTAATLVDPVLDGLLNSGLSLF